MELRASALAALVIEGGSGKLRFRLEQQHFRLDTQEIVFATGRSHVVAARDRVDSPRDRGYVIGKVLRGDRHPWTMPANGLRGSTQRRLFRALDIHLDEIHAREPQLSRQDIDGGECHLYFLLLASAQHKAVARRVAVVAFRPPVPGCPGGPIRLSARR